MSTLPAGDALERLGDDQRQLDELFDTFADHQRNQDIDAAGAERLALLICTLVRVHDELEEAVLEPALWQQLGAHPALDRAAIERAGVHELLDLVEAMPGRDPRHAPEMARLAQRVRARFAADEARLFELARETHLDLAAMDLELGWRQENLLSAGRFVH